MRQNFALIMPVTAAMLVMILFLAVCKSGRIKEGSFSHYAGETGELFKDLSTMTSVLDIAGTVRLKII